MRSIQDVRVACTTTVRQVMERLDACRAGIVLVVDESDHLVGTVTDGDVRRAVLAQRSLETVVTAIMSRRPVTAAPADSLERVRDLMDTHRIRHVPVVDEAGTPQGLFELQDLVHRSQTFPFAVVMAGGEGKRLWPLTQDVPKPMLKVGEIPVLENLVKGLAASGIERLYLAVNYKAEIIESHFKDGQRFGVHIQYLRETRKLGTAGPLSLLPEIPSGPFLVVNGDIITDYTFSHLYDYHWRHRCVLTVGVSVFRVRVPYGVPKLAEHYVLGMEEKPVLQIACNAGIYAVNPEVLTSIPKDRPIDMTDLLDDMVRNGLPVTAFAIHESWLDVGQLQDLAKAQQAFAAKPHRARRRPARRPASV